MVPRSCDCGVRHLPACCLGKICGDRSSSFAGIPVSSEPRSVAGPGDARPRVCAMSASFGWSYDYSLKRGQASHRELLPAATWTSRQGAISGTPPSAPSCTHTMLTPTPTSTGVRAVQPAASTIALASLQPRLVTKFRRTSTWTGATAEHRHDYLFMRVPMPPISSCICGCGCAPAASAGTSTLRFCACQVTTDAGRCSLLATIIAHR